MASHRTIRDYYRHVRHKAYASGCCHAWGCIKLLMPPKDGRRGRQASVRADALKFHDKAVLRFNEDIVLDHDGRVRRSSYSYEYRRSQDRGSFFFRYDESPDTARPLVHEECHLHVIQEEPRYKTHETSFEEFFDFIIANFYPHCLVKGDSAEPSAQATSDA